MLEQFPTLQSLRAALDTQQVGVREVTQAYLDRIFDTQPELNSFITVTDDYAVERAEHAQKEIDAGNSGALTGIPYAAKDVFTTRGIRTTAASNILKDYIPPYSASVIETCSDAVLLGKANLDEFAMGTTGEYSAFGATKNPYDLSRVAGGSSSGPAAIVASGQAPFAWGTDTGGSIRLPSAFTHTVGYKPTYGTYSRYGVISMASSLDTIGTFTRSVEDAAYIAEHLAPHRDAKDMTMYTNRDWTQQLSERIVQTNEKTFRFGIPKEFMSAEGMDPSVKEAFDAAITDLQRAGVEIVEVSLPSSLYSIYAYYLLTPSEVSSNMARYDGVQYGTRASGDTLQDIIDQTREEGFGAEVKRRILIGAFYLSQGFEDRLYHKASQVRTLIMRDFEQAFGHVDVLLCPASPKAAFGLGENLNDPLAMWLADVFTVPMNIVGVPTVNVPGHLADGLPTGVQCIGPHGRDDIALAAAWFVQETLKSTAPQLAI